MRGQDRWYVNGSRHDGQVAVFVVAAVRQAREQCSCSRQVGTSKDSPQPGQVRVDHFDSSRGRPGMQATEQ